MPLRVPEGHVGWGGAMRDCAMLKLLPNKKPTRARGRGVGEFRFFADDSSRKIKIRVSHVCANLQLVIESDKQNVPSRVEHLSRKYRTLCSSCIL
jgi:hypothetical protein